MPNKRFEVEEMKAYLKNLIKKRHIKLFLVIILICAILPLVTTLTRYILEKVEDYYLESKNFYFNSNYLKKDNPLYQINNWTGIGNFTIDISLNSSKNNLLSSDFDITYDITYTCPADLNCTFDNTSGIIYKATHTDSIKLTIIPTRVFEEKESATIHVEATSKDPYVRTISADFQIIVGKTGVTYAIDDAKNNPYLIVSITNALTSYKVTSPFSTYQVGDELDINVYRALSDQEKKNCVSATISLSFDPNIIVLDTTSEVLKEGIINNQDIDGLSYVNKITFTMDAMSSQEVRFYKIDHTKNYTYPIVNQNSIVTVEVNS